MKYRIIPVTPFQQNCSLLWCQETMKGAVVDPGGDLEKILAAVKDEGVTLEKIILTHGHLDHVGGTAKLSAQLDLPIEGPHRDDEFWIQGMSQQCQMFGFPETDSFVPNRWLEDGDEVEFGNVKLKVLHTPGHTPGHLVLFHKPSRIAIVGDVLFQGSIGRTDFPKGDHSTLIKSIKTKLWPLGPDVRFLPGHGPMSTFGDEMKHNPYVGDRSI